MTSCLSTGHGGCRGGMKLFVYHVLGGGSSRRLSGEPRLNTMSLKDLHECISMMLPAKEDEQAMLNRANCLLPGDSLYIANVGWVICLNSY